MGSRASPRRCLNDVAAEILYRIKVPWSGYVGEGLSAAPRPGILHVRPSVWLSQRLVSSQRKISFAGDFFWPFPSVAPFVPSDCKLHSENVHQALQTSHCSYLNSSHTAHKVKRHCTVYLNYLYFISIWRTFVLARNPLQTRFWIGEQLLALCHHWAHVSHASWTYLEDL